MLEIVTKQTVERIQVIEFLSLHEKYTTLKFILKKLVFKFYRPTGNKLATE